MLHKEGGAENWQIPLEYITEKGEQPKFFAKEPGNVCCPDVAASSGADVNAAFKRE